MTARSFSNGVENIFYFDETLYSRYCDYEDHSTLDACLVHDIFGSEVVLVGYCFPTLCND